MQINIDADTAALILRLQRGERRLAYAAVNSLNKAAKAVQAAQREDIAKRLKVRKTAFIMREIAKISPFASVRQARAYAEVAIGEKPRLLLGTLAEGGVKEPAKGKHVAVPITGGPARPSFQQPVKPEFTFRALRLRRVSRKRRGSKIPTRAGLLRTFSIPDVGVFQRVGKEDDEVKLVYTFQDPMQLRQRLRWRRVALVSGTRTLREELQRQAVEAIARSGGRLSEGPKTP